ncbi:MAG: signal peptidase II [Bdellovibrionales bacterium]|nr:signal peptidase II [Bdellovibrionales bacterium]
MSARARLLLWITLPLLAADQLTKAWARGWLREHGPFSWWGGSVRLVYHENTGAFLSLGANLPEGVRSLVFSAGVGLLVVGLVAYYLRQSQMHRIAHWAFCLMIAGGAGNLIDRVWKSSVTDFLVLGAGSLQTGVFNVADMAISAGAVLMVLAPQSKC